MAGDQTRFVTAVANLNNRRTEPFPASVTSLLQLRFLLSEPVVDLGTITEVITSDNALYGYLMQCAIRECDMPRDAIVPLSELVIHLGIERLLALTDSISVAVPGSLASC